MRRVLTLLRLVPSSDYAGIEEGKKKIKRFENSQESNGYRLVLVKVPGHLTQA